MFTWPPEKLSQEIIKKTVLLAVLPLLSTLLTGHLDSFLGLTYGLVISILLFRLKLVHNRKALNLEQAQAINYIRRRYLLNYLIYFLVLFTAYRNPDLNFLATAIGLLLLKYTILGLAVVEIIKEKWHNKMKSLEKGEIQ